MGLLDSIFGGSRSSEGGSGGPSPLALALMALLAYRSYKGQGGGGLADMLGGGRSQGGSVADHGRAGAGDGAGSPGEGGGLGGLLGGLFGGSPPARDAGSMDAGGPGTGSGGGLGGLLRGGLGGTLAGGAAGGFLGGGLSDLIRRFEESGQGGAAQSWVGSGPNSSISPNEIEHAVGRDTLEQLSTQTGRPYDEVLSELSRSLPETVDKLTPDGRLPTEDETSRWV